MLVLFLEFFSKKLWKKFRGMAGLPPPKSANVLILLDAFVLL